MANKGKNNKRDVISIGSGSKKIKGLIHGSHLIKSFESQWLFLQPSIVRHLLLMFDELVVMDLPTSNSTEIQTTLDFLQYHKLVKIVNSAEYLARILARLKSKGDPSKKQKVFLEDFLRINDMIMNCKGNSLKFTGKVLCQEKELLDRNIVPSDIFKNTYNDMGNVGLLENSLLARNFSSFYSEFTESSVTPIIPRLNSVQTELIPDNRIAEVLQVIIPELPVPSETTPFEKIVEFKLDESSIRKFRRLKHWISKVSRMEISRAEIEEEFQELIFEYRESLQIHKIEYGTTTFEMLVSCTKEIIQSGKLFALFGLPFCFKKAEIALMKLEQNGKGHEVAYILHAKDTFS